MSPHFETPMAAAKYALENGDHEKALRIVVEHLSAQPAHHDGGSERGPVPFLNYCEICGWSGCLASCPNCNGDRGLLLFVRSGTPWPPVEEPPATGEEEPAAAGASDEDGALRMREEFYRVLDAPAPSATNLSADNGRAWLAAFRFARDIGAASEREKCKAEIEELESQVLQREDQKRTLEGKLESYRYATRTGGKELEAKLAEAESRYSRMTELHKGAMESVELCTRERQEAESRAGAAEAERDKLKDALAIADNSQEHRKAKLAAWEPVVRAAIEQTETDFFFEGSRIRHCREVFWPAVKALPAEMRPTTEPGAKGGEGSER